MRELLGFFDTAKLGITNFRKQIKRTQLGRIP